MICAECKRSFDRKTTDVGNKYCSIACAFFSGVDINQPGCWFWKRKKTKTGGYGLVKWKGQEFFAQRISYAIAHDFGGKQMPAIFNMCGNRDCVRSDHWTTDTAWKWVYSDRYKKKD